MKKLEQTEKLVYLHKKVNKLENRKLVKWEVFRTIIIVLLVFVILLPLYKTFIDTINVGNTSKYYFVPLDISFARYRSVFRVFFEEKVLYNSLWFAFICAFIEVIFSAVSGYSFAKLKFKGSNIIFYIYILTLLLPKEFMRTAFNAIYNFNPLFGIRFFGNKYSIFVLYAFGAGIKAPVFVFMFRSFFRSVPVELFEQSQIDGCTTVKTFTKIIFPMSLSVIIPTFVLSFIWAYNDSYFPNYFLYSSGGFDLIATRISSGRMFGGAESASFFMMLPVLIMYILIEKRFLDSVKLDYSL